MRLAVTTVHGASDADRGAARAAATRHAMPFAERRGRSLARVAGDAGADALLVLSATRAALWLEGREWPWHAGMGELRLRRLLEGEGAARATADGFLAAAMLRPGEAVLDATLGMGADALVASAAVGAEGRVVGVEASPALAALVAEGLRRHGSDAARRVEVLRGDANEILSSLPERSFDLVTFDPMFRHAREGGPALHLVRRLADARPLAPETVARARRVARRAVLVKDGAPGWDLARLGLVPLPSARGANRLYARIDAR